MTLLHHEALDAALRETDLDKRLVVTPLLELSQIRESSIDLRLGTEFLLLRRTLRSGVNLEDADLQARIDNLYEKIAVPLGEGLWLHPQQFVLGATFEFVRIPPTLGAYVLGRSSWGRLGLLVATAILVGPGFAGSLTLELVNAGDSPIKLYPGLKIAQLAVHSLPGMTTHVYAQPEATYRSPTGPQPARLAKDQAELERIRELGRNLTSV
jgi:dCTP deaminase